MIKATSFRNFEERQPQKIVLYHDGVINWDRDSCYTCQGVGMFVHYELLVASKAKGVQRVGKSLRDCQ
jgi:hypothetical protein